MSETDDTVSETSDVEVTANKDDYEAQFVARMSKQFEELDKQEEAPEEEVEAPEEETEEVEETEEAEEPEETEEEDEDKVSIRINGKKADVNDLLEKTQHTVKLDGEELEVGYDDLIKGYQRGSDYHKKTTELKKEREELRPYAQMVAHAKTDPKFVEYVQSYFTNGPYPEAATNPLLKVNDADLAGLLEDGSDSYDPHKAAQVIKARNQWQEQTKERESTTRKAQEEQQRMYQEWAQGEIQKAKELITEMGGNYEEDGKEVVSHLSEAGFSEQEIGQLVDARLAVVAWEAAQYRKLLNSQEAPKARIGKKRQKLSPPRPMAQGGKPVNSSKRQRDTYRKAVNSQRTDDWVAAIEGLLR